MKNNYRKEALPVFILPTDLGASLQFYIYTFIPTQNGCQGGLLMSVMLSL